MTKYVPTKGDVIYVIYPERKIRQGEIFQPINKGHCLVVISQNIFIEVFYSVNFFFTKKAAEKAISRYAEQILPVILVKDFIRDKEKLYAIVNNRIYRFILSNYKYEYLGSDKYNIGKKVEQLKIYELGKDLFVSEGKAISRLNEIKKEIRRADEERNLESLYKEEISNFDSNNIREDKGRTDLNKYSHSNIILKQKPKLEPKIEKIPLKTVPICESCGRPIDNIGKCGCS